MIEDINFNIIDNNGVIKKYVILEKFNKNNKNYIIYKEENKDDLYAALYEIINETIKIIPITNDQDYDIVDEYLENIEYEND